MDHHCPWMNNCIGIKNQKAFLLFNFYTALSGAYATVRTMASVIYCFQDDSQCYTYKTGVLKGFAIGLSLWCGLFVIFTSIMLFDQIKMKYEETSTIDKM